MYILQNLKFWIECLFGKVILISRIFIVYTISLLMHIILNFIINPIKEHVSYNWLYFKYHHSYTKCFYHPKRYKALIFNHNDFQNSQLSQRSGTDNDARELTRTLRSLGFLVSHHFNETKDNIMKKIKIESQDNDTAIFIFILTHGKYGSLAARDGFYDPNELFNIFPHSNSLICQPKIIFIQACQELDPYQEIPRSWSCIPNLRDFMVVYGTSPGNFATRDTESGSWLIQYFCKIIQKMNPTTKMINLNRIITSLTKIIHSESFRSAKQQIPFSCCTLTRKFELENKNSESLFESNIPEQRRTFGTLVNDALGNCENLRENVPLPPQQILNSSENTTIYPIPTNHTGKAVIILNNPELQITNSIYKKRLTLTLQNLGFQTQNITFLCEKTKDTILNCLQCISKERIRFDCLLVFVISKGANAMLQSQNNTEYEINQLWTPFRNCFALEGKPKIFIINSDEPNYLPVPQNTTNQSSFTPDIHDADFLFAFSTGSQSKSNYNKKHQHFYITSLLDVIDDLNKRGTVLNFLDILIAIHQQIKFKTLFGRFPLFSNNTFPLQIANYSSTLSQEIAFPPMVSRGGIFSKFIISGLTNCSYCWWLLVYFVTCIIPCFIFAIFVCRMYT